MPIFGTAKKQALKARLTHLDGRKLDKFDLDTEERAEQAKREIERRAFAVASIDRRQVRRNPPPPFITSTLQQEASRKLGLGAATAMRIAQRLYEGVDIGGETVGLITYMRTDGVQLAPEAIGQTRDLIETKYGATYVPASPRIYTSKAKNAQEAHEAIRPTDLFRTPQDVAAYLDEDQLGLYELIWKRTVASQMESAVLDQVTVDIASGDKTVQLRATGSVVKFDGFLTLYDEGQDDKNDDEETGAILPDVTENEAMDRREVVPEQHFTEPPPRYSEASLVKKLEELGIGRPSTYASIIEVLQRRNYVQHRPQALHSGGSRPHRHRVPADLLPALRRVRLHRPSRGRARRYLRRQDRLARSAARILEGLLGRRRRDQGTARQGSARQARRGARSALLPGQRRWRQEPARLPVLRQRPPRPEARQVRRLHRLLELSRMPLHAEARHRRRRCGRRQRRESRRPARSWAIDPVTGKQVTLRKGPYGLYVQLGEPEGKEKPKRQSLLRDMTPNDLTLEKALALLSLPRELGPHPEDGEVILAGVGRFGPYVKHGPKYKSVPSDESVLDIGMNRAVALLAEAKNPRGRAAVKPIRSIGNHPSDEAPVELYDGRYGPYVKHGGVNATVPRDIKPEELTLDQAVALLAERAAKGGGKKKPARGARRRRPRQPTTPAPSPRRRRPPQRRSRRPRRRRPRPRTRPTPRPHRHRWLRARSRPATNCWPSSARAKRPSASARSPVPTG